MSLASPEIMFSFPAGRSSLAGSVEDPLEASPLCRKVALADSVEDPLEASPLCSKVALAGSVGKGGSEWLGRGPGRLGEVGEQKCWGFPVANQ